MALKGPSRVLRELWHCRPAPAGKAASAVGSRPGRGWQEAEARLTAEEAALWVDGQVAFGYRGQPLGLGGCSRTKALIVTEAFLLGQ